MVFLCLCHWLTISQRFLRLIIQTSSFTKLRSLCTNNNCRIKEKVPIFQILCLESQVNRILGVIVPNIFKFANNYLLSRFYGIYSTWKFPEKKMFFFLWPVFVIQRGKSQTKKAFFTYQKVLCHEPVTENI